MALFPLQFLYNQSKWKKIGPPFQGMNEKPIDKMTNSFVYLAYFEQLSIFGPESTEARSLTEEVDRLIIMVE